MVYKYQRTDSIFAKIELTELFYIYKYFDKFVIDYFLNKTIDILIE